MRSGKQGKFRMCMGIYKSGGDCESFGIYDFVKSSLTPLFKRGAGGIKLPTPDF